MNAGAYAVFIPESGLKYLDVLWGESPIYLVSKNRR